MCETGFHKVTYSDLRAMSAENVYTAMAAQVNGPGGMFERELREQFTKEHPTLQQAMIRHIVRPMLEVLVADERYSDERNERATQFARLALEAANEVPLPTI